MEKPCVLWHPWTSWAQPALTQHKSLCFAAGLVTELVIEFSIWQRNSEFSAGTITCCCALHRPTSDPRAPRLPSSPSWWRSWWSSSPAPLGCSSAWWVWAWERLCRAWRVLGTWGHKGHKAFKRDLYMLIKTLMKNKLIFNKKKKY